MTVTTALAPPMPSAPRFPGPLAASLALHVALLASAAWAGWGPLRVTEPEPPVYLEVSAPVERASAVTPQRAAPRGQRQAVRKAAPRAVPPVAPAQTPEAEAIAPERVMPTAPANEQATPAAAFESFRGEPAGTSDEPSPGEVHGTPEASVTDTSGDAGIASARAAYLASVRARLESRKHYPYLLRRQGITGTVLVAFTVGGSGEPSAIRAADGPHHPHLVEAAVRSVRAAAPFAPLPAELAELQIEVPIAFVLENE